MALSLFRLYTNTVRSLNLNEKNNKNIHGIARALRSNSSLESLDLSLESLSVESSNELGEVLALNDSITSLSLELIRTSQFFTRIGGLALWARTGTVKPIIRNLRLNSSIRTLKLRIFPGLWSGGDVTEAIEEIAFLLGENSLLLTSLCFTCGPFKGLVVGWKALAESLKINRSLTSLELIECRIGDEQVKTIAEGLEGNGTLRSLNLSHNDISSEGAKAIASALKGNHVLTSLDLTYNHIGSEGIRAIVETDRLTSLSIQWPCFRSCAQLNDFVGCLIESNSLIDLCLMEAYWGGIGVRDAKAIKRLLLCNNNLRSLKLAYRIDDNGIKIIFSALKVNTSLTTLDLIWNDIGNDGAKSIANVLRENRSLTSLDLRGNEIGLEGMKAIAEALRFNTVLTSVNFSKLIGFMDRLRVLNINNEISFRLRRNQIMKRNHEMTLLSISRDYILKTLKKTDWGIIPLELEEYLRYAEIN